LPDRESYDKSGSFSHLTLHLNRALVLLDDAVAAGEPKSHPFLLRREKGMEDIG
jgi:hypothetical protein